MVDEGEVWSERAGDGANEERKVATSRPLVSVIVPVRDDPDGIRALIRCLAAQTLSRDRFEVVIGDDGSQPELAPVVDAPDDWVRVVPGPPRTSYAARNRAARAARGSVLAFCDSDCLPEPTWLEEALAALDDADVVAGEVRLIAPTRLTAWSLLTMDMFLDQERNVLLSRGVTANLVVRRRLFDELRGFDESLPSGGDYDFVQRTVERGARLRYAAGAVVRHPTLDNRRAFLRKVWTTNRWSAVRRARSGLRPEIIGLLTFVPVVGVVFARHQALRSAYCLHRPRLRACGLTPSWRYDLRTLPVLYFLVAYVAGLGRAQGWWQGRRLARTGAMPCYASSPAEAARSEQTSSPGSAT
jgi:GT2 family glycosyltransferase